MKQRITLLVTSCILLIFSLVQFIKSFSSYSDGGYGGFEFSTDAMIILLTSIVVVVLCSLVLYQFIKGKSIQLEVTFTCAAVAGFNACYSLFTALKIVGKAVSAQKELSYDAISTYIPWGLIAIGFTVYFIFTYLELRNKR